MMMKGSGRKELLRSLVITSEPLYLYHTIEETSPGYIDTMGLLFSSPIGIDHNRMSNVFVQFTYLTPDNLIQLQDGKFQQSVKIMKPQAIMFWFDTKVEEQGIELDTLINIVASIYGHPPLLVLIPLEDKGEKEGKLEESLTFYANLIADKHQNVTFQSVSKNDKREIRIQILNYMKQI